MNFIVKMTKQVKVYGATPATQKHNRQRQATPKTKKTKRIEMNIYVTFVVRVINNVLDYGVIKKFVVKMKKNINKKEK